MGMGRLLDGRFGINGELVKLAEGWRKKDHLRRL